MSSIWGKHLQLSLFGESHGEGIGIVLDNLPPGQQLDLAQIKTEMARRAPGGPLGTPRKESDQVEILSGLFHGKTTGAPLCGIIRNQNTRSQDYTPHLPRPSHADFAAHMKYKGFEDYRGGGHFSGRLTAPLTFAGAIAKQYLQTRGITVGGHVAQIGSLVDSRFETPTPALLAGLAASTLPLLQESLRQPMEEAIAQARVEGNSLGGAIECVALGLPAGLGSPFFSSVESLVAGMLFSIPGVKGVEFGSGFALAGMTGSQANDAWRCQDGSFVTLTNHSGGINGGISNGMPLVVRLAIRPTPSIALEQETIDLRTNENSTMRVHGRHDPCIVPRALPVAEAALALCLLELLCAEGW